MKSSFFRTLFLFIIITGFSPAQEVPLSKLLYSTLDFEFKLSPNGEYLASVKKAPSGYFIFIVDLKKAEVYQQIPLGKEFVHNLNWISDTRISYSQELFLYAVNIDGTESQQLISMWKDEDRTRYYSAYDLLNNLQSAKMVNTLENDFEHILVEKRGIDNYPIIYKLDIFTGEKEELENGEDEEINHWLIDRRGKVRFGIQNDDDKIRFFNKNKAGKWEAKNELKLDLEGKSYINQKIDFMDFSYDENIIYLASSINNPRWQILSFDINKKAVIDTILSDMRYDIGNPVHSDTKLLFLDSEKKLVGVRYERQKPYTEWFHPMFKAYEDSMKAYYHGYYADIFDWNTDGSVLLIKLFSDIDPGHIMIYDAKTNKHMFYVSFASDLKDYKLSKTKFITYKARDGYELEGYLNLPATDSVNYPFIVMPHGGPYVRDYWDYDPIIQFFANQGYGVLRMNFRGSTGYGIDHLLSGVKQLSGLMIDDIADGAKWALENKYADSSKVFLYGHSYGGYAALQSIIRYPEIYKAAVCIGSPTDFDEMLDYVDEQDDKFNYEFLKTVVGDPDNKDEFLEKISPINQIDKITRPVFLFHGENDKVVPVSQTKNFVEEAESLGKTIEYKIIKDEDHSISENRNTEYILKKALEFFKENSK